MPTLHTAQLRTLSESVDLECKAAQGRDGHGEVPASFWESYSAMANTNGGVIYLGIEEKPRGTFNAKGLTDLERVRKAIWDNLHNPKQISLNLLTEENVAPVEMEGKTVLKVEVPRAARQQRPIHVGENPFTGTFLRRHEGDYRANEESVRRMLAERVEEVRDERILKGFEINDLDMESIVAYRNRFSAVKSGHIWLDLPIPEFLEKIGAYGHHREEGYSGVRLAGLLMFGRAEVIREALPNYMVDYQERAEAKAERRWVDRLAPDGTWSGNVYDFFRRVYQKLTVDLKVPFQLQDGQRVEDTPLHEALREALVNTLIHADFTGRVSVLVVKRPDMFGFRNPGLMRVPIEVALRGGNSDCRNRRLQTMFQLVGYGDHAGSGIPKIYGNWEGQHWRSPLLYEIREPEQTLMELRMTSLLPHDTVAELEALFGDKFRALPQLERMALATAAIEGIVNHARLREVCTDHSADISKALGGLVRDGFLFSDGLGRGTVYFLPITKKPSLNDNFDPVAPSLKGLEPLPKGSNLLNLGSNLALEGSNPLNGGDGGQDRAKVEIPFYLDVSKIPESSLVALRTIAQDVRGKGRVNQFDMWPIVHSLCRGHYLSVRVLAAILERNEDYLRPRILKPMVEHGALMLAYPDRLNHPDQAYTAVDGWSIANLL